MTAEGRVVILDFGLIAELLPQHAGEASYVSGGTPAYMSPEEASGATPSEAGDWYGIGVTLYEALTGTIPFAGPLTDVLAPQADRSIRRRPAEVAPDVPADLSAICMGLLVPRSRAAPVGSRGSSRTGSRRRAAGAGHHAGADPRHAIRRPRSSASGVERGLPGGHERGRGGRVGLRPVRHRQERAGPALSRARSPRATMSSCSPAAATRTSRCLTRRSTGWSTI